MRISKIILSVQLVMAAALMGSSCIRHKKIDIALKQCPAAGFEERLSKDFMTAELNLARISDTKCTETNVYHLTTNGCSGRDCYEARIGLRLVRGSGDSCSLELIAGSAGLHDTREREIEKRFSKPLADLSSQLGITFTGARTQEDLSSGDPRVLCLTNR